MTENRRNLGLGAVETSSTTFGRNRAYRTFILTPLLRFVYNDAARSSWAEEISHIEVAASKRTIPVRKALGISDGPM